MPNSLNVPTAVKVATTVYKKCWGVEIPTA